MLILFMCNYLLPRHLHKLQHDVLTDGFLEGVSFIYLSMFYTRVLVKLGRFYGEDLDIYSWWIRLAEKLTVYGRMDLVIDMATYANR